MYRRTPWVRPPLRARYVPSLGSADVSVSLTGQAATVSAGTLVASVSYTLTGQSATVSQGTITQAVSYALSGQSLTGSTGTLSTALSYGLTGQAATSSAGTITVQAGADVSVTLTGQAVTASSGTLTSAVAYSLTGQASSIAQGSATAAVSQAIAGQALTTSAGTLTASVTGDVTVALSGLQIAVSQGFVATLGGTQVSFGAGSNKRRRRERYVVKHGDEIRVFSTPEEMEAYVEAAQAVEAPKPKKKREPIRIELAPQFAEEVATYTAPPRISAKAPPSVAIEQIRRLERRLVEIDRQRADEEEEDDEVLLWLM